ARRVHIVAGPDQQVIADNDRGHGGKVLFVEARNLLFPALLAGLGVQADQVIVMDLQIEIVVPHAHAAVAGVGAATGLPVVVPEDRAVARIDRPGVIRRGHINHAIHHQDAPAKAGRAARIEVAIAEPADDDGSALAAAASAEAAGGTARAGGAAACREAGDPGEV